MDQEQRIQQFRQMAEADPDNELGHFSLGKAYFDAGRFDEAVAPLSRVLELKPELSKAYQLLGEAYDGAGKREQAVEVMTKGVTVADQQGDIMPRDAMVSKLEELGAAIPELAATAKAVGPSPTPGASTAGFRCARCGRVDDQLPKRPFKGEVGEKILANVCAGCWKEWIGMGTKVINELSLVLGSPSGQRTYDQYMIEFLQLENR